MKPNISIIVPVYNTEKYVQCCIESLMKQTYNALEIIIINDGSVDKSLAICEELAKKDLRIKIFTKSNGGLSDARNFGIKKATGDYLGFVDSDDYVSKDMYEKLFKGIIQNGADIAVSAINQVNELGDILKIRSIEEKEKVLTKYTGMEELLFSQRISNSVCNKLFKRELFDDLEFPVGKLYEDEYVTYILFDKSNKIYVCDDAYYYYRYNDSSITHSEFSTREFDRIIASEQKIEFCNTKYPKLVHLAEKYLVYDAIIALSKMKVYEKSYDRYIKKNIRKYLIVFLEGRNSMKAKAFAVIAAINPNLASWFFRKIDKISRLNC